jgi:hypothetical protein
MGVTINQVVQDALGILGEVTGIGTQLYSEPRMVKDAGRAFNMLFKKHWWTQYTAWGKYTLDGATGTVIGTPFTQVIDFDDFRAVYAAGSNRSLPTLPESGVNIFNITGTTPRFWGSIPAGAPNYAGKKIIIHPQTSTGEIVVRARYHPLIAGTDWSGAMSVEFDRDLLVFGTAYVALSGDDLNPQAKADVQQMMDGRYKDIQHSLANQHTASGGSGDIPRHWFSYP